MPQAEDVITPAPPAVSWVVHVQGRYYTGSGRSPLERWTAFPKFAKRYRRQAWAQKIAAQLGGQAVAVANSAQRVSDQAVDGRH